MPVQYLSMAPFLMTILVLVLMSAARRGRMGGAPGSLGKAFHASG